MPFLPHLTTFPGTVHPRREGTAPGRWTGYYGSYPATVQTGMVVVNVYLLSWKQIQGPTLTWGWGGHWPRAPPTIAPNLSRHWLHPGPLHPMPPEPIGQECLLYNFPPASSHSTMLKAVGPYDSISIPMKKHEGWRPPAVPPTRDGPVDLQWNCNTASAPAPAGSQALEQSPSGRASTPSLAPVSPMTNLDPHLTATMTTLSR